MVTQSRDIHADSKTARANGERVAQFFAEVLATGKFERAPAFLSPDFFDHDPTPGAPSDASGVAIKLKALWSAFPDGCFSLKDVVAAGDRVVARSLFTGTQTGPFGSLVPTGRHVEVSFTDFYQLADGMLAEHWHDYDQFGMIQQLTASR